MLKVRQMLHYERQIRKATIIELLPSSEQIKAVPKWQKLEQSIRNTGLTNSWPWIKAWLDNYGNVVQPTFAFGKRDNQLIGAALIIKATHSVRGIPIPSVHLGTAGEPEKESTRVEYNRLLVAPENLDDFALELVNTLQQKFRWSELRLDGFVPDHAHALIRAGINTGLHFMVDERRAPAFNFQQVADEGHDDVISALRRKTRHGIRHSLRVLESNFGPRSVEWAETAEQARDILRELIYLHQKRWECIGVPGAFQSDRVKRYHDDLIDKLSLWPHGSSIAFRVKSGERTIGCLFGFTEDGHLLGYKAGFDMSADIKKLAPGLVAHVSFMEQCMRYGLKQYEFLAGEAPYKEQLSNTEGSLIWAAAQRGPRMWLIDKARPPFQLTRDLVQSVRMSTATALKKLDSGKAAEIQR